MLGRRQMAMMLSATMAGGVALLDPSLASACGCFTPPDPTVPIVQAGERITFAMEGGDVVSHIQIQYSGPAEEFGWLLPLPSEPTMELGTDELFAQLIATTQPKYRITRQYEGNCPFDPNQAFPPSAGGDFEGGAGDPSDDGDGSVLVREDSVGPYDYAILRADSKDPMLAWLNENRYFVPAGTDAAVDPYIRPGAFFLALRLRKGNDTGDLQPVVVRYQSDLPMIPIVLTSVAADPNMGVMVWMLGDSRAIPRNYYHTVINDAAVDWFTAGSNYVDVITDAVDESPEGRSFVTEYAGSSAIMQDLLDYPGRFGDLAELRTITDPGQYLNYLYSTGYATSNATGPNFFTLGSQILGILDQHLPVPPLLLYAGITPDDYYLNFDYYNGTFRAENPRLFVGVDTTFDPNVLTDELEERVVRPTLAAGQMFRDNPYMTRMFTTLSPEEMLEDPVFSFNPDLPEYSNIHEGTLIFHCGFGGWDDINEVPATLVTSSGWKLALPDGQAVNPWIEAKMPKAFRIEILREEGPPEVVTDNGGIIAGAVYGGQADGGCSVAAGSRGSLGMALLGLALVVIPMSRLRRGRR